MNPSPFRLPLRWTGRIPEGGAEPLNCLLEGTEPAAGLAPLSMAERSGLQILTNAPWPSVRAGRGVAAEAGPTGAPWVDANGWRIRLAQHLDPGRQVILDTRPPDASPPSAAQLVVAEAMAYGAAWAVTYDPATWPGVRAAIRFFLAHSEWRNWTPVAAVTVVSPFTGPDAAIAGEYLNLLTRRQIGFALARPGDTSALARAPAAVWASSEPIPWETFQPWIRAGGRLILFGSGSRAEGRGSVAALAENPRDPYASVSAIHLALTRRSDVLRLWNGGSFNTHYVAEPGGRRGVVHLLNYAAAVPSHDVSLWLARPWRSAWLNTLSGRTPLKTVPANGGIEVPLSPVGVYAALELEA